MPYDHRDDARRYMLLGLDRRNAHAALSGYIGPTVDQLLDRASLDLLLKLVWESRYACRLWLAHDQPDELAPILYLLPYASGEYWFAELDLSDAAYGAARLTRSIDRQLKALIDLAGVKPR